VDWLNGTLCVERGIVHQVVDDVKTPESQRTMYIDSEIVAVLKMWKQLTQFSAPEDWVFASPVKIGRLPSPTRESGGHFEEQRSKLASVISVRIPSGTHTDRGSIGWYSCGRPTTAHAPHGHQNHDERVRHGSHGGYAAGAHENR
jgi:hypothetical protein